MKQRGQLRYAYLEGAPVVFDDHEGFQYLDGRWKPLHLAEAMNKARLLSREEFKHYFGQYPHLPEAIAALHEGESAALAAE